MARMPASYRLTWAALGMLLFGILFWNFGGRAWYRRYVVGFVTAPEEERTAAHFVAVSVPRLSKSGEKYTMKPRDFRKLVASIARAGYVPIMFSDVQDFYERKRLLPPKAILITLDRDDPRSVEWAEGALARHRMRGSIFVNKTYYGTGTIRRHSLAPHAVRQMTKSGAWEFGWFSDDPMPAPEGFQRRPVLDNTTTSGWTRDCGRYPIRYEAANVGYNGFEQSLCGVRLMRVRADRTPEENFTAIESNWPRTKPFFDDFRAGRLKPDWIVNWGVVSGTRNRLAVIPTPRQTSASVHLNGTDEWTDAVVDVTFKKYKRGFWVYLRYDGKTFVRVGARDGWWKVEQKAAPELPPKTLARAPIQGLPARLSIVVKNSAVIVHVNGRLAFRNLIQLDPRIEKGRVELIAFDPEKKAALGVVDFFHAAPLPERWLSLDRLAEELDQPTAVALHDFAVRARGMTPRWYTIKGDGHLLDRSDQLDLVRNLSGFNRCLLAPTVDFEDGSLALPADPGAVDRLIAHIADSARVVAANGVNLRVPASADRAIATAFSTALRRRLRSEKRKLWVTLEGAGAPHSSWAKAADAVLRPSRRPLDGAELLEIYDWEAAARAARGG